MDRELLQAMLSQNLSLAEIGRRAGLHEATVGYWVKKHDLRAVHKARHAARGGIGQERLRCSHHGETEFWLDLRGYYRCKQCRSAAVSRRRRRMKQILVKEAGGACRICGYDRNVRALHFHHLDPARKRLELNARGTAIALETLRREARKCVLLCANCHAEVEAGLITLAPSDSAPYNAP